MKTFTKILALALVVVMSVVMLVSCSTYGKIEKAFEDAGYTLQNADNEKTGTIETDDGVITYTIHTFQKEAEDSDSILGDILGGITLCRHIGSPENKQSTARGKVLRVNRVHAVKIL